MKTPRTSLCGLTIALLTSAALLPQADAAVTQQIEAPGSDKTTIAIGESLNIYDPVFNNLDPFTIDSGGTLTNFSTLENYSNGTLSNYGTLNNSNTLDNFGTLSNYGTLNNTDELINFDTLNNNGIINGSVDVQAGGILTGSGTINGSVLLEGAINPGNSPGTITTSNQTWFDGASYGWEVNDSDGIAGGAVGWDLIEFTTTSTTTDGTLDLSNLTTGGFGIDIISLDALNDLGLAEGFDDPNGEYEFVIVTTVDGIIGFDAEDFVINDDDFQNTGSWDWSIAQDGNNLVLKATGYTLVPEPSSLALLGMGGLGLLLRRKRS